MCVLFQEESISKEEEVLYDLLHSGLFLLCQLTHTPAAHHLFICLSPARHLAETAIAVRAPDATAAAPERDATAPSLQVKTTQDTINRESRRVRCPLVEEEWNHMLWNP